MSEPIHRCLTKATTAEGRDVRRSLSWIVSRRAFLILGAQLNKTGRDCELGGREALAEHLDRVGHRPFPSVGIRERDFRRVASGPGVQIDPDHGEPPFVRSYERNTTFGPRHVDRLQPGLIRIADLQRLTLDCGQRCQQERNRCHPGGSRQVLL